MEQFKSKLDITTISSILKSLDILARVYQKENTNIQVKALLDKTAQRLLLLSKAFEEEDFNRVDAYLDALFSNITKTLEALILLNDKNRSEAVNFMESAFRTVQQVKTIFDKAGLINEFNELLAKHNQGSKNLHDYDFTLIQLYKNTANLKSPSQQENITYTKTQIGIGDISIKNNASPDDQIAVPEIPKNHIPWDLIDHVTQSPTITEAFNKANFEIQDEDKNIGGQAISQEHNSQQEHSNHGEAIKLEDHSPTPAENKTIEIQLLSKEDDKPSENQSSVSQSPILDQDIKTDLSATIIEQTSTTLKAGKKAHDDFKNTIENGNTVLSVDQQNQYIESGNKDQTILVTEQKIDEIEKKAKDNNQRPITLPQGQKGVKITAQLSDDEDLSNLPKTRRGTLIMGKPQNRKESQTGIKLTVQKISDHKLPKINVKEPDEKEVNKDTAQPLTTLQQEEVPLPSTKKDPKVQDKTAIPAPTLNKQEPQHSEDDLSPIPENLPKPSDYLKNNGHSTQLTQENDHITRKKSKRASTIALLSALSLGGAVGGYGIYQSISNTDTTETPKKSNKLAANNKDLELQPKTSDTTATSQKVKEKEDIQTENQSEKQVKGIYKIDFDAPGYNQYLASIKQSSGLVATIKDIAGQVKVDYLQDNQEIEVAKAKGKLVLTGKETDMEKRLVMMEAFLVHALKQDIDNKWVRSFFQNQLMSLEYYKKTGQWEKNGADLGARKFFELFQTPVQLIAPPDIIGYAPDIDPNSNPVLEQMKKAAPTFKLAFEEAARQMQQETDPSKLVIYNDFNEIKADICRRIREIGIKYKDKDARSGIGFMHKAWCVKENSYNNYLNKSLKYIVPVTQDQKPAKYQTTSPQKQVAPQGGPIFNNTINSPFKFDPDQKPANDNNEQESPSSQNEAIESPIQDGIEKTKLAIRSSIAQIKAKYLSELKTKPQNT